MSHKYEDIYAGGHVHDARQKEEKHHAVHEGIHKAAHVAGESGCGCGGCGSAAAGEGDAYAEDTCGCGSEHAYTKDNTKTYIIRLVVGITLFVTGILASNLLELPEWAELSIFLAAYLVLGTNVLVSAAKNIIRGKVFDENFLMMVATVGAFILRDYMEATAVMLFYLVGETLSDAAVNKSRKSIAELMDIRPDHANVERGGELLTVNPSKVQLEEIIVIKPGEKVPLDCAVTQGNSTMETSALTGESLPRDVEEGSELLSGFVNGEGLLRARVTKVYGESTASKILRIVEFANNKKAHTEKFITKFAKYYTPAVCAGALAVAVIPGLVTGDWSTWVYRALLFLVISCPCALVVSVPLTYFGGIGGAGRRGILVKGANYLEALSRVTETVFDKTGTLTKGVFEVQEIFPADGYSREEVLRVAAMAEVNSSHPIAKSVLNAYGKEVGGGLVREYRDIAGHGVSVNIDGDDVLAGNATLMEQNGIGYPEADQPGTLLYVAKNGAYMGMILIADELKANAKDAMAALEKLGVKTAMLTGDSRAIANKVAAEIGVQDVKSELLPQDKVDVLEEITASRSTAFVGDGINDAPVLARADVGIAMGALGSDAAIEAADIVLMTDDVMGVPLAIQTARKTRRIVIQNIVFALAVKAVIMVLGVLGLVNMWAAVFGDVGVTIIAVLNSLRALKAPRQK